MLCKNEDRDPAHCLKEGRKVTRCAQEIIGKIRESCLAEFDAHWKCLENNNQVGVVCAAREAYGERWSYFGALRVSEQWEGGRPMECRIGPQVSPCIRDVGTFTSSKRCDPAVV